MQNIGTIPTGRTFRATELLLAMIVVTVALLFAMTVAGTGSGAPSELPEPGTGHTVCVAEGVPGPCS